MRSMDGYISMNGGVRMFKYEWISTDERDGLVKMDEYG